MQVPERDEVEVATRGTEEKGGEEKRRPVRVSYELDKENRQARHWIATLLCFPAFKLLLCRVGQQGQFVPRHPSYERIDTGSPQRCWVNSTRDVHTSCMIPA